MISAFCDVCLAFMSVGIMSGSIYVLGADWGSLAPNYFDKYAYIGISVSLGIMVLVGVNCVAIRHQKSGDKQKDDDMTTEPSDSGTTPGPWCCRCISNKKLLIMHNLCLFVLLVCTSISLFVIYSMRTSFNETATLLKDGETVSYDTFEGSYSDKFNDLFFAAADSCGTYSWFWDIVDEECANVSSISQSDCSCSRVSCAADESSCDTGNTVDCAYDLCRSGLLEYMYAQLETIFIMVLTLWCVVALDYLASTMLTCYNPRASFIEVLKKNGTVKMHYLNSMGGGNGKSGSKDGGDMSLNEQMAAVQGRGAVLGTPVLHFAKKTPDYIRGAVSVNSSPADTSKSK